MNKKAKIIRYTSFTIGMVSLSCGVVFLFAKVVVPSIVCLTLAIAALIFAFLPYPFLKKEEYDEDPE